MISQDQKLNHSVTAKDDTATADVMYLNTEPKIGKIPNHRSLYSYVSIKFGSPFLVLTEGGCSGTTAILSKFLNKIVKTHGYRISTPREMLNVGLSKDSYDPLKIKKKNHSTLTF